MRTTQLQASPLRDALIAQALGSLMAAALIYLVWPKLWETPLAAAAVQGACAALAAHKLDSPRWWIAIHLVFVPLVVAAGTLQVAPGWYLAAFVLSLLVFWRTDSSRVPLFLTNATAAAAVAALLPARPCHVVDLGCGDGGLLRQLARARPDCEFLGIEHAPLPWLWARIRTLGLPNVYVRYGNLWSQHLGLFDVVYAFLSPAPMPELWRKAVEEMNAGALLVSNSFAVPDVAPERTEDVDDRRGTRLYVYRLGK
ncbi:MAG: class I SAM-dependent methyltransferase [Ignavibacteria bacterium]